MNETETLVARTQPHFTLALMHAAQMVGDELESALSGLGLSMAKQSALTKLAEAREALTLSELAARLSCVRSNITQLVDRLEADGLVKRVDDASDRRSVRAELTATGAEKQRAGAEAIEATQLRLAKRLSKADRAALESALGAFG